MHFYELQDPLVWLDQELYKWGAWRQPGNTGAGSLGYAMPAWACQSELASGEELPASASSRPERGADYDRRMSTLDRAIMDQSVLTDQQRRAIMAVYADAPSLSQKDIAATLRISPRTLREHIRNAQNRLLEKLQSMRDAEARKGVARV